MGSYKDAPSTKMLAVFCAVCSEDLRDAKSVELGIGPVCRKKYGYDLAVSEEAREEANAVVHHVAIAQTGLEVAMATRRLRELGFEKLAARIEERVVQIRITEEGGRLVLESPYSPEAVLAMRGIPGRQWDHERKMNTFPPSSREQMFAVLKRYYPGALAYGPKGSFTVPGNTTGMLGQIAALGRGDAR